MTNGNLVIRNVSKEIMDVFTMTGVAAWMNIVSLFRSAANQWPDNIAVIYEENSYTYGELDRRSNDFAAAIMEKGLVHGDVVSILIPRGEYMAIASLGALKAGCAY